MAHDKLSNSKAAYKAGSLLALISANPQTPHQNPAPQVACRSARQAGAGTGVQLASVWVEAVGSERVDGSWVAAGYAAGAAIAARQGRHLLRHLFHVHSRPVLQHALLTPGFSQRFAFRSADLGS